MSFVTRCPACATHFKVVSDQLKISDGWVRCGHCSDVFDATIHLEAWVPPHPPRSGTTATATPPPQPAEPVRAEESIETLAPEGEPDPWLGDEPRPVVSAEPPAQAPVAALVADESPPTVEPDFHSELQQFASAHGRCGQGINGVANVEIGGHVGSACGQYGSRDGLRQYAFALLTAGMIAAGPAPAFAQMQGQGQPANAAAHDANAGVFHSVHSASADRTT